MDTTDTFAFAKPPPLTFLSAGYCASAFAALLLTIAAPLAARQKKPTGKISDPAAFMKIADYCVDVSGLPSDEAYDVKGFVQTEGQPGKLLSKISWKLVPDCAEGEPDTMITLEFPRLRIVALGSGAVDPEVTAPEDQTAIDYHTVALLRVFDAGSRRLLYDVQANPLDVPPITNPTAGEAPPVMRRQAMYGAFWTLAKDIALVSSQNRH